MKPPVLEETNWKRVSAQEIEKFVLTYGHGGNAFKGATEMFIVQVHVHVKPECVDAFREATLENARNSVLEPGIARFDLLQQQDDPTRFVLVEVYRTPEDPAKHKETDHYEAWRDTVADLMAEPRSSVKYYNVFPQDSEW